MIPVAEPSLGDAEAQNLQQCVQSNWIAAGKFVTEFETSWAAYCGQRYGVAVSNGTVALQLALAALELPPGSEVIIPSFTIISCGLAALHNGLKPVLVDVRPDTWCLDPEEVEAAITPATRAIMAVHMYGHPADMQRLGHLAAVHHLKLVEDAAQAHGAEYMQMGSFRKAGGSDLSCFSFYTNKIVTSGEGGMVLTSDPALVGRLRSLRNLCFGEGEDRFQHTGLGHNFRMTDLQAAVGVAQVAKIETTVARKREIAHHYRTLLKDAPLQHPVEHPWAKNVYWMYGVVLNKPAAGVIRGLRERGVDSRPFFRGLHRQPGMAAARTFPVTERLGEFGLYLPSGISITYEQQEQVARTLLELL